MSYTGDELEFGLEHLAEKIIKLIYNYQKETGYAVDLTVHRDTQGNLSVIPTITLSASATILKRGELDS